MEYLGTRPCQIGASRDRNHEFLSFVSFEWNKLWLLSRSASLEALEPRLGATVLSSRRLISVCEMRFWKIYAGRAQYFRCTASLMGSTILNEINCRLLYTYMGSGHQELMSSTSVLVMQQPIPNLHNLNHLNIEDARLSPRSPYYLPTQ